MTFEDWRIRLKDSLQEDGHARRALRLWCQYAEGYRWYVQNYSDVRDKRVLFWKLNLKITKQLENSLLEYLYKSSRPELLSRKSQDILLRLNQTGRRKAGRRPRADLLTFVSGLITRLGWRGVINQSDAVRLVYLAMRAHGSYDPGDLAKQINDENVRKRMPAHYSRFLLGNAETLKELGANLTLLTSARKKSAKS